MSSSRTILSSLKIPLTAISKRIHHTIAQPMSQNVIAAPISKNIAIPQISQSSAKFSASIFKDGKAYPVGRRLSPEELANFKATAVPREQIKESLEIAAENHRQSVYG